MRALISQPPFQPEVPFAARISRCRNQRNKQRAFLDLLPDRRVPRIATAQFRLVEPDFEASHAQGIANTSRCLIIL